MRTILLSLLALTRASSKVPLNQFWAAAEEARIRRSDNAATFFMFTSYVITQNIEIWLQIVKQKIIPSSPFSKGRWRGIIFIACDCHNSHGWKHLRIRDEVALKGAAATIAEISLRARLTRVAVGLLRPKAPRMGYRK